jgi:hypothetical protein
MKKNILGGLGILFGIIGVGSIFIGKLPPMNLFAIISVVLGGLELNKDSKNPIAIIALILGGLGILWRLF